MTTAVDSSVLLDVLVPDPVFGERSREALRLAYDSGALIACDVVWAEVRAHFPDDASFEGDLDVLGIDFDPVSAPAAALAGRLWRDYRERAGSRDRIVADFIIGAHALSRSERLLTRDRGFFRRSFADLELLDPSV